MRDRQRTRDSTTDRTRHGANEDSLEVYKEPERDEETEFDFDADLEIDKNALDKEWLDHPRRHMKYSKAFAVANRRRALAEERMKTIRSEVVNKAEGTPAAKNAATLEAFFRTNPAYKRAKRELIDAQFEADLLNGAVFAMQSRSKSLENLVKLYGSDYFSSPKEPDQGSAERISSVKQDSARNRIRGSLNR